MLGNQVPEPAGVVWELGIFCCNLYFRSCIASNVKPMHFSVHASAFLLSGIGSLHCLAYARVHPHL